MVTSGANQAYANIVLSCVDHDDQVVFFAPYYFNHVMAVEMTGGQRQIIVGPSDAATLLPDLDWLEARLAKPESKIRLVTIVNPGNPSGVMLPLTTLQRCQELCERHGVWLVVDNTYCLFGRHGRSLDAVYGPTAPEHECVSGPRVANIFSFSKAYGMMGWRLGVLAAPTALNDAMAKAHDTIAICAAAVAQRLALEVMAIDGGSVSWVTERVLSLAPSHTAIRAALSNSLGDDAVRGGSGAIYLMARLPPAALADDARCVAWLARRHGVVVIPGSACGLPGWIRVCYANLPFDGAFPEAVIRLEAGMLELREHGFAEG